VVLLGWISAVPLLSFSANIFIRKTHSLNGNFQIKFTLYSFVWYFTISRQLLSFFTPQPWSVSNTKMRRHAVMITGRTFQVGTRDMKRVKSVNLLSEGYEDAKPWGFVLSCLIRFADACFMSACGIIPKQVLRCQTLGLV